MPFEHLEPVMLVHGEEAAPDQLVHKDGQRNILDSQDGAQVAGKLSQVAGGGEDGVKADDGVEALQGSKIISVF